MRNDQFLASHEDIEYLHETFVLFGDPDAPYWFLGLEEGDHPGSKERVDNFIHGLIKKSQRYSQTGKLSLRDLCAPNGGLSFLPEVEASGGRTGKNVKYQSTWGGYIKFLLSVEQEKTKTDWTLEDVKKYQKYDLGALGETDGLPKSCLMELFPMARKGRRKSQWPYKSISTRKNLECMKDPKSYQRYAEARRVELLMSLVKKHKPKYLVCFGSDCKRAITSVVDEKPQKLEIDQGTKTINASTMVLDNTRIVFSNHPTSHGISTVYWKNLGSQVASMG